MRVQEVPPNFAQRGLASLLIVNSSKKMANGLKSIGRDITYFDISFLHSASFDSNYLR